MQIAVIGAGIAGLAATKVLTSVGHDVTAFDTEPEVGGVWSPTRHYPGLTTQNTRMTYEYSDHPAPASWPDYPSAGQWHSYLSGYVDRFGFGDNLRLGTGVSRAEPTPDGWDLHLDSGERFQAAHLIVANGVFSRPLIPDWPGRGDHARAGGVVKAPSQQLTIDDARGKDVVIVGYGKSACDYFDLVRTGEFSVRRDSSIVELRGTGADKPEAVLDDGTVLRADLVVAATGFEQSVPFLDPAVTVRNASGEFVLFRNVLPIGVPNLSFAGYNTSLVSSLSAEVGAVWTAAHLAGALNLPSPAAQRATVARELVARKKRTHGKQVSGTAVLPHSLGNIDQLLGDLHAVLPRRTRVAQWSRRSYSTDFRNTLAAAVRALESVD